MTLTQLRYALAIAKHGNFARAADSCRVAQPTLSLQLQKLEKEVGAELFDRRRNPVVPTAFGREFLEQARVALREADKLEQLARPDQAELTGSISIGIIPTVSSYLLPRIFKPLNQGFPGVEFRFFELPTSQIVEKLAADELELGVLATPLHQKDLAEQPLYYEPFVAYFPPSYAGKTKNLTFDQLDSYALILLSEEHCFRHQSLKICSQNTLGKVECGSIETIKKMVDIDVGLTLLPLLSINPKHERVGRFRAPEPVREIGLVYRKNFYKHRMLKVIQAEILKRVPAELHERGGGRLIGVEADSLS